MSAFGRAIVVYPFLGIISPPSVFFNKTIITKIRTFYKNVP